MGNPTWGALIKPYSRGWRSTSLAARKANRPKLKRRQSTLDACLLSADGLASSNLEFECVSS
jgi:hypothetical protein